MKKNTGILMIIWGFMLLVISLIIGLSAKGNDAMFGAGMCMGSGIIFGLWGSIIAYGKKEERE